MKKTILFFLVLALICCLSLTIFACNKDDVKKVGQIPVYQGMTLSGNGASASAVASSDMDSWDNGKYKVDNPEDGFEGGHWIVEDGVRVWLDKHGNKYWRLDDGRLHHKHHAGCQHGDYSGRDAEMSIDNPIEEAPTIEEKVSSSLEIIGAEKEIYYATINQDVYVTIHISNPDSFEILSFVLNGSKYTSYMFEQGSDLEHLILKVNVGNLPGIKEYTIDEIKYVDGTEIKDVVMEGDKTVKAGIYTDDMVAVDVDNEEITLSSISFDANIIDTYSLIEKSEGFVKAYLYDGENITEKEVVIGKNEVAFDNLTPNTIYEYAIIAYYDDLTGDGKNVRTLFSKQVYTNTIVLFDNLEITQTTASWDYLWDESIENKEITGLELFLDGEKVKDLEPTAKAVEELLCNRYYSIKATYKNLAGEDEYIFISFTTQAKAVPTVEIANIISTKTTIDFDIEITDEDEVCEIKAIKLYQGENLISSATIADHINFEELTTGTTYKIVVEYAYDLNDGAGTINDSVIAEYPTLVESISVTEMQLLNKQVVKKGEELNLRVYFDNPSEIELTSIYVNEQIVNVVGGDRIESAIIKFVPEKIGLIDFAVSQVKYNFAGTIVSQVIDTDAIVTYPIYGDINPTFTAVTASPYDWTGVGTYFEFDNEEGYVVYNINGVSSFTKFADGEYYTEDNSISSIEYGYDGYGHTTQTFTYSINPNVSYSFYNYKKIETVEEFLSMTNGYYFLMNDLDLRSVKIEQQINFTGIFEGNGHTIRGLTNVIDTSKSSYFNFFNNGNFYNTIFKELYISVESDSQYVSVSPLGGAKLTNCSVSGDIVTKGNVSVSGINSVENSTSCNINVTQNGIMNTIKYTGTPKAKNSNVVVAEDGCLYYLFPNGKKYLIWSYLNSEEDIVIDGDVVFIGNGAFYRCDNLKSVTILDGVEKLGFCAFANCSGLTSVTIPDSVASIGGGPMGSAFEGCDNIEYYKGSTEWIGYINKTKLEIAVLTSGTNIGNYAFSGCSSLTSITIPDGVTSIGDYAFAYCNKLISITIPDSVTSIGDYAFSGCSDLQSVTIPDGVMSISYGVFTYCNNLVYNEYDNAYYLGNETNPYVVLMKAKDTSITSCEINPNTKFIMSAAFHYCSGMTNITIPTSVVSIGSQAFEQCGDLKVLVIPENVYSIGFHLCDGCNSLTDIIFEDTEFWYSVSDAYDWRTTGELEDVTNSTRNATLFKLYGSYWYKL